MVGLRRAPRRRDVLIAIGVCVVLAAGLAGLWLFLAPRVLPVLQTHVVETDRAERVGEGGVAVSLVVPAGWSVQREGDDAPRMTVRTPDAKLAVEVDTAAADPADVLAASGVDGLGSVSTEVTTSGLSLVHAEAPGVLVMAVASGDGAPSARMIARADPDLLAGYRAEIARLIDTVRVEP